MTLLSDIKSSVYFLALALLLAFGTYTTAGVVLNTDIPVVAVVSNSMEHDATTQRVHLGFLETKYNYTQEEINNWPISGGFVRGDLLVIMGSPEYNIGDVVVYTTKGAKDPQCEQFERYLISRGIDQIVHRVVYQEGDTYVTKGDHNNGEDPCNLTDSQFLGKVVGVIPKLGFVKILPSELISSLF